MQPLTERWEGLEVSCGGRGVSRLYEQELLISTAISIYTLNGTSLARTLIYQTPPNYSSLTLLLSGVKLPQVQCGYGSIAMYTWKDIAHLWQLKLREAVQLTLGSWNIPSIYPQAKLTHVRFSTGNVFRDFYLSNVFPYYKRDKDSQKGYKNKTQTGLVQILELIRNLYINATVPANDIFKVTLALADVYPLSHSGR